MTFYAHPDKSQPDPGDKWQLLEEHLRRVAELARDRAKAVVGGSDELATMAWWKRSCNRPVVAIAKDR